jgi:hypothetical protein
MDMKGGSTRREEGHEGRFTQREERHEGRKDTKRGRTGREEM